MGWLGVQSEKFQSLEGILLGFNELTEIHSSNNLLFQSLEGILLGFNAIVQTIYKSR